MGAWSWLKSRARDRQKDPAPARYFSAFGNAIQPEWHGSWRTDERGVYETRRHVGQSAEGFHAGVESVYRVGVGRIDWSDALPTPEQAMHAACEREIAERNAVDQPRTTLQAIGKAQ